MHMGASPSGALATSGSVPAGSYRLQAELIYQTLSEPFARHLFTGSGPAVDWVRAAYAGAAHKSVQLARLDAPLAVSAPLHFARGGRRTGYT